jgi:hypothetical protein
MREGPSTGRIRRRKAPGNRRSRPEADAGVGGGDGGCGQSRSRSLGQEVGSRAR